MNNNEEATNQTFPLTLTHEAAWLIQSLVKPNASPRGMPDIVLPWRELSVSLREKVNDVILRFEDEQGLEEVTIDCEPDHAWLLDAAFSYDGYGGTATRVLIQCFRGLWALGYHMPFRLVPGQPQVVKEEGQDSHRLLGLDDLPPDFFQPSR